MDGDYVLDDRKGIMGKLKTMIERVKIKVSGIEFIYKEKSSCVFLFVSFEGAGSSVSCFVVWRDMTIATSLFVCMPLTDR